MKPLPIKSIAALLKAVWAGNEGDGGTNNKNARAWPTKINKHLKLTTIKNIIAAEKIPTAIK